VYRVVSLFSLFYFSEIMMAAHVRCFSLAIFVPPRRAAQAVSSSNWQACVTIRNDVIYVHPLIARSQASE
jgi:hypothetical protein